MAHFVPVNRRFCCRLCDQYVWSGVNGFTDGTAQVNVNNIDVTQGGLYELYVVTNGCKSDVANITLEVNQKPSCL